MNVFIKKCLGLEVITADIGYGVDFLIAEEPSQGIPNSALPKNKRKNHSLKKIIFTTHNKYFSYAMLTF